MRTLLRLDPWIPYGKTWLCPNLPEGIGYLKVEGIPLAGSRVTIEVGDQVPGGVSVKMPGIVPKLSETPGGVNWQGPTLGQHTDDILGSLGLTGADIQRLKTSGVVQ